MQTIFGLQFGNSNDFILFMRYGGGELGIWLVAMSPNNVPWNNLPGADNWGTWQPVVPSVFLTTAGTFKMIFNSSGMQVLVDGSALSFTQMSSAYQAAILGKLREKYRIVHNGSHPHENTNIYTGATWGSTLSNLSITTS